MPLNIRDQISNVRRVPQYGYFFANAFERIQDAINGLGTHLAADPTGTLPAISPLQSVNVSTDGGNLVHVSLVDNSSIQKNINYFVEWSTDGFTTAHVEHLGVSRERILNLPQGTYSIRGFHQTLGGLPSTPIYYGGASPIAVVINSGSTLPLLAAVGSGTGAPDGSQPGVGLGKVLFRQQTGPKRTLGVVA